MRCWRDGQDPRQPTPSRSPGDAGPDESGRRPDRPAARSACSSSSSALCRQRSLPLRANRVRARAANRRADEMSPAISAQRARSSSASPRSWLSRSAAKTSPASARELSASCTRPASNRTRARSRYAIPGETFVYVHEQCVLHLGQGPRNVAAQKLQVEQGDCGGALNSPIGCDDDRALCTA